MIDFIRVVDDSVNLKTLITTVPVEFRAWTLKCDVVEKHDTVEKVS